MRTKTIDMHLHPKGCWSSDQETNGGPSEALEHWLNMIGDEAILAVTEHDTVVTYEALLNEMEVRRISDRISLIPGVEASSVYQGYSNHILGYWLKQENESMGDIVGFMLKAAEDILISTTDGQYWKYAYPAKDNVRKWRTKSGHDDADRLTVALLEQVRDNNLPSYQFGGWRISPHTSPGSATVKALNHMHIAKAMEILGWIDDAKETQEKLLKRGASLYPGIANGNNLDTIEENVRSDKVVAGLYNARCLVVLAHPHELARIMLEDIAINELGYTRLIKNDWNDYSFEDSSGKKYLGLTDMVSSDTRFEKNVNMVIDEIWGMIIDLTKVGLRGVELYNRYSYDDLAMEYITQKLELKIDEYNEEHPITPIIKTAGTDNHRGFDGVSRPGILKRQLADIDKEWYKRDSYLQTAEDVSLYNRTVARSIEQSIVDTMKQAKLDPNSGLYLLPNTLKP